jgi:hypothetical protein
VCSLSSFATASANQSGKSCVLSLALKKITYSILCLSFQLQLTDRMVALWVARSHRESVDHWIEHPLVSLLLNPHA